jgi:bifunctional non-homologous end joining protein LigD
MPKKQLPDFVAPMQASSVKEPFDSLDWIFETKLDGYRAIAVIDSAGKTRIWSRNHLPLEPKFPTSADAVNQLKLRSTILDGEIVALDKDGIPRFQLLQQWQKRPTAPVLLFCFTDRKTASIESSAGSGNRSKAPPIQMSMFSCLGF